MRHRHSGRSGIWGLLRQICLALLLLVMVGACRGAPLVPAATTPTPLPPMQPGFLARTTPGAIRLMSFNVGWDSIFADDDPQNHPFRQDSRGDAFARIVRAVRPDILCLQEINPARDPAQVAAMFDELLPLSTGASWQAHSGQDNVIVASFPLALEGERSPARGPSAGRGHALALVDLPESAYDHDLYLICAHFKSQGGQANIRARQEQADAIVQWLGDLETGGGSIDLPFGTPIFVLGDLNVYDTDPARHLDTLLSGDIVNEQQYGSDRAPDWDGSALADVLPRHNGRGTELYTWRDDTQEFNPGVLDHILYTDSVLTVEHAFVLNTATMTAAELQAAGLRADDVLLDAAAGRYDHLPLVADFSLQDARAQ